MSIRPPRDAPPPDPRTLAAVEAIDPRTRAERFTARHAPARSSAQPEQPDPGRVLAKLARGPDELRVSLHTYNGKPYVRVAVWGADGWPVRGKAVSVRVKELGPVVSALCTAMDEVDKVDKT